MTQPLPSPARATLELAVASLGFAVMAILVKHAARTLGAGQIALVRFAFGAAFVWGHAFAWRQPLRFVRRDFLFLRAIFGGAAVILYFFALVHLPVGTATLLDYSSPVFVVWFSAIFLGEHVGASHVASLFVAGTGVVLVILGQGAALGGSQGWMLLGLVSAVCSGGAVTAIRAARRTDSARAIFGSFCVVGALCSLPLALADWQTPDAWGTVLLAGIGATSVAAQLLMTHAVSSVHPATAGILSQVTVVFAMVLGAVFDQQPMTWISGIGSLLTVGGAILANALAAPKR